MTTPLPHLSHPKYRPDIDGLRAIAVLPVVLFHAFPSWMQGGFIGVDVFFVISGFLISTIIFENLDRGTFRFAEFYARRIKRIFPALLLVLIASHAFGWFALLADEYKQLGKHIAAGAGFVANFTLWGEASYFDNAAETKPLLHLWSLGIEEQFYIVWPLLAWLAWKRKFNFLLLIISVALVSFALNLSGAAHDPEATFYSPQTRFWELLCGSLLAWLALYKKAAYARVLSSFDVWLARVISRVGAEGVASNLLSFLGLFLLAYGYLKLSRHLSFPGAWALVPVVGAALLIVAGPAAWVNRKILSNKMAVWFGLISFPLYLWHWPLLSLARIVESDLPSRKSRVVIVVLSIFLAWLTYRFIERPIRLGMRARLKVPVLVALMVIVGCVGYDTYRREGLISRAAVKNFKNNNNELLRTPAKDDECLKYLGIKSTKLHYCRFSAANSSETIAVVGDSHAHVAFPGIARFALKHHTNTILMAISGCPPFLGAATGRNPKEKLACKERTAELLETLVARADVQKVFLFSRGPIYWTGAEPLTGVVDEADKSISMNEFFVGAQKTINFIAASGKQVYFVTENPELSFSPSACIPRPFRLSSHDCTLKRVDVALRFADYARGTSSLSNAVVVDSMKAFCPIESCLVLDESGSLLYADDDHLSVSGSEFLVRALLLPFLRDAEAD